jgi:hypothetical protein
MAYCKVLHDAVLWIIKYLLSISKRSELSRNELHRNAQKYRANCHLYCHQNRLEFRIPESATSYPVNLAGQTPADNVESVSFRVLSFPPRCRDGWLF